MKNVLSRFLDWVSDTLFLEFYLDKHWTFRFKLMNLVSGDSLREYLVSAWHHLDKLNPPDGISDPNARFHIKRAKYWTNAAWNSWRK